MITIKTIKPSKRLMVLSLLLFSAYVGADRELISINSYVGDEISALMSMPASSSKIPACIIFHGSGGLFKENEPGENCGPELENNFELVFQRLEQLGVAVLAPDSFGRDARFCEDNDNDYFQFVPPPFHNLGDGVIDRESDGYKVRRILTRVLDGLAALEYLTSMDQIDANRICLIGTSNGGSTVLALSSNNTQRHVTQYSDTTQTRPLESQQSFSDRQLALQNYPVLNQNVLEMVNQLPVANFSQAIAPGCYLRQFVPTKNAAQVNLLDWPDDFFHPQMPTLNYPKGNFLYVDMGSEDSVPDHCKPGGIRQSQAMAYQEEFDVDPIRWLPQIHEGFDHDLLGDNNEIIEKTDALVIKHFYLIFKDSF